MATIRTAIQIQDGMSGAMRSMNTAMNVVLSSFESLQTASGNAINTASIQLARQELVRAETAFNNIEEEIRQASDQQRRLNGDIHNGTNAANGLLGKVVGIAAAYLSFQSVKGIVALSDELTNTTARLDLMNNQYQETELQAVKAYATATDLMGALGKNAESVFGGNKNAQEFTDALNGHFKAANMSASDAQKAVRGLSGALSDGVIRGEELNQVFAKTPSVIDNVAKQMGADLNNLKATANVDLNVNPASIDTTNIADQLSGTTITADILMDAVISDVGSLNSNLQETEQLQQKIFDSAQRSYGAYADTAALVGKLGMNAADAFSSTDEIIGFSELLNKQFGIAGTNAEGVKNATLQLTQALGGGVLRGQELNSIFEHAPNIIHTIADYLDVPIGKIREMAGDGLISATVVKNAMFAAADGINERFDSMPLTFEQLWTSFKNEALWAFQPVLQGINDIANNDKFQSMISNVVNSLYTLSVVAMGALDIVTSMAGFMYNNWAIIEPVILGTVAALLVYNATMGIAWLTTMRTIGAKLWSIAVSWAETAAIIALTIAQQGLNAALLACPITWIIIGIIAIIAIFYAAVAAVNHFAGTTISATGIIVGVLMTALAFIGNLFIAAGNLIIDVVALIWNFIASFVEFFANVFNDPIGSIMRLFADLGDFVLGILEGIASAIDTLFGSNLASAVSGWRNALGGMVTEVYGEAEIKIPRMDASALHLDRFEYGKAYDTGYNLGAKIEDKFSFGGASDNIPKSEMGQGPSALDIAKKDPADKKNKADTAKNTAKMAKSMDAAEEDLKYMRDLAERDVINRFTTASVKVDFSSTNTINSDLDLDGIIDQFAEKLEEALDVAAEGA